LALLSTCLPPPLDPTDPNEAAICRRDPGVPTAVFNQFCSPTGSTTWLLSSAPSPNALQFAVTARHAVWQEIAPAPTNRALFWVRRASDCNTRPSAAKTLAGTANATSFEAISVGGHEDQTYVYFDGPGNVLQGAVLPDETTFAPLSSATADQQSPGGSDPANAFAWQEGGDIWRCPSLDCQSANAVQITQTADRDERPRAHQEHVVWENATTGQVMYAKGPAFTPMAIDRGQQPDVRGKWIVYAKSEPSPDSTCQWSSHTQIWAYGPLDSSPQRTRISSIAYWGAANFKAPRLTDDYVVFLVDYLYARKMVVGIYPIAGFGTSNAAMLEVDDGGGAIGNVDAWQDSPSLLHVLYRDPNGAGAKLRCCLTP